MTWTTLNFGDHKEKTLPQVLFTDPDWFFWAWGEGAFDGRGSILREARLIHARATSILPPPVGGEQRVVDYFVQPSTGKFLRFDLVESSRSQEATSPTYRSDVIDMSIPRTWAPYDKQGNASLVRRLKYYFYDNGSLRMTKERCEAFFDDLRHFRNAGE